MVNTMALTHFESHPRLPPTHIALLQHWKSSASLFAIFMTLTKNFGSRRREGTGGKPVTVGSRPTF